MDQSLGRPLSRLSPSLSCVLTSFTLCSPPHPQPNCTFYPTHHPSRARLTGLASFQTDFSHPLYRSTSIYVLCLPMGSLRFPFFFFSSESDSPPPTWSLCPSVPFHSPTQGVLLIPNPFISNTLKALNADRDLFQIKNERWPLSRFFFFALDRTPPTIRVHIPNASPFNRWGRARFSPINLKKQIEELLYLPRLPFLLTERPIVSRKMAYLSIHCHLSPFPRPDVNFLLGSPFCRCLTHLT